ncbi:putative indole-3-acetic acid-amido synthetase GH3.10 [Strongylocentrotus purpuratus]|uniref:Uncharacterized protein n=1 Tax=Strongylocentrotus purpuratus TaxID=7668 RepID=A0A7M7GFP4_STRPU|nr:putative indole-3-acetic acid-amido synthetase GH3.10 [Strongylocentrotus purpuratus]
MKNQNRIIVAGIGSFTLGIALLSFLVFGGHHYHFVVYVTLGWVVTVLMASSLAFLHIGSFDCCQFTPGHVLVLKYIIVYWLGKSKTRKYCESFDCSTKDCSTYQADFLLKKIRRCEDTVYGQDFNFRGISSVEDFIKKHPLTSYDHYQEYIKRVADGEVGVMSYTNPAFLGMTSGTTGNAKLFPVSNENLADLSGSAAAVSTDLQTRLGIEVTGPLVVSCCLLTGVPIGRSEGGIPKGPVTSFMMPDSIKEIIFSTPLVGYKIMDESTAMYVHALFALRDENLSAVWAPFASSLYIFFRLLEASWKKLAQDIRRGSVSDDIPALSDKDRKEINARLLPMPERADELEMQFRIGFDNIVSRLWPRMPSISGTTSGSMQTYVKRLKKYTGDLQMLSRYYISTEGLIGYAIGFPDDGQTEYVCIPDGLFYEFIPISNCNESSPATVLMEDVKKGECYEVVITNKDGLYRYRMGDVILITRFYNKAPVFQFQYRRGELLNLCSEKTSEVMITTALNDTVKIWKGAEIVQYACAESPLYEEATGENSTSNSLYYVIFVELSIPVDTILLSSVKEHDEFEREFDANLRGANDSYYDNQRQAGKLQLPRIIFVDGRAFPGLRDYMLENSTASASQFKLPRKLRKMEWILTLLKHEVKDLGIER